MLILTRKADQEIIIDGNIRIRVLSVKGNSIRLGLTAPDEVSIIRGELEAKPCPIDPVVNDSRACDLTRRGTGEVTV